MIYSFIYPIFLNLYYNIVAFSSIWNPKAKLWIDGRLETKKKLPQTNLLGCIWFHTASLGEFEQVSFLIESIKKKYPTYKILITFYSPSGFEPKKNFTFADEIMYLPFDFKKDMENFITKIKPAFVFWVRYEFWYHALSIIHKNKIPLYLLNGVFHPKTSIFYTSYLKDCLSKFTKLFVISENSQSKLLRLGFQSEVLYDTRYERMKQTMESHFEDKIIHKFSTNEKIVVCGSIWSRDDKILMHSIASNPDLHWILVPHEINANRITQLLQRFPDAQLYTNFKSDVKSNILIVDTMGFLSKIYRFADVCYIGGGFDKVVHSLIEPLAYGVPIIIGKNINKSEEAKEFVQNNLVSQIFNSEEFNHELVRLFSQNNLPENKRKIKLFDHRLGSINKIMCLVEKNLDL